MNRDLRNRQPRRFWPASGARLTIRNVRGPRRPSGSVHGACVLAVVWSTDWSQLWAPLNDLEPPDQLRHIETCRRLYVEPVTPRLWPEAVGA